MTMESATDLGRTDILSARGQDVMGDTSPAGNTEPGGDAAIETACGLWPTATGGVTLLLTHIWNGHRSRWRTRHTIEVEAT